MSDQRYIQAATRRSRLIGMAGLLALLVACGVLGARNIFYDRCTASFERGDEAVVSSYIDALARGETQRAQDCWERNAYFSLGSGCSELCLERVQGAKMRLVGVEFSPAPTAEGRDRRSAAVTVACEDGSQHSGSVLLDAPAGSLPWKHWRVVESNVGGSAVEPWCGGG